MMADEFAIRPAYRLVLQKFDFETSGGEQLVFFSNCDTLTESIYFYRISSTGVLITTEAIPLSHKDTGQTLINVIPTSDGNFVIIWLERSNNNDYCIQKVTPEGQCLWADGGVVLFDQFCNATRHKVLPNAIGGVTVVYQDSWDNPIYGQNFDNEGNKLWGEAGLTLVEMDDLVELKGMAAYPGGGFLLHLYIDPEVNNRYEVLRFSDAGMLVSNQSIVPTDLFANYFTAIVGPENGEYLVYRIFDNNIQINKVGVDGQPVLAQNISFNGTLKGIKLLSNGRVAYLMAGVGTLSDRLYMLSPSLEPLWNVGEIFGYYNYAEIDEFSGGTIMVTVGSVVQFFDTSGAKLLSQSQPITTDNMIDFHVFSTEDSGIFLWSCKQNTEQVLKLQALSMDGSLTHAPTGLILEERLVGICGNESGGKASRCFALDNRFVSIWYDTRAGLNKGGIYYQLLDQNMQPLLEPNGRPLRPSADGIMELRQAILGNDNRLYLLYRVASNGRDYLQAIDYYGSLCFGEGGIEFGLRNQIMGIVDHVIYLFWTGSSDGSSSRIMGQKYVNGIAQWNQHGEQLLGSVTNHQYTLLGFENGLLVYSDQYSSSTGEGNAHLKALMFDVYGLITSVGGDNSIILCSETISPGYSLYGMGKMGDDLCLIVRRNSQESTTSYILQKVSPQGHWLWGASGINFGGGQVIKNTVVKSDALCFLAQDDDGYSYHSVDALGNFQTPEAGINIIPAIYAPKEVDFAAFDDGSMICAFTDGAIDSDVYYRRMNADGTPTDSAPVVLCNARNAQSQPRIATYSNTALITWIDERAGEEVTGLWGNTVQSSTPVDDALQTPIHQAQIIGNYPNPFNPSTTISYNIAVEGMAKLEVYNIKGQLVKTLVKEHKARGKHQAVWDGKDFRGKGVASGVFFVRLSSAGKSSTHKMLLKK